MSTSFESLSLAPELLAVLGELGYDQPTPVQVESIPALLAGRDLIGQSKTGSGKTAAFALPMLQSLDVSRRELQGMILCPTRELCAQVAREVRKLGRRHAGLSVLEVAGGQPIGPQLEALDRGVHIAVGTPGRLIDHLDRGTIPVDAVRIVVLDEADRMLDMGFGADVETILALLPAARQMVMFSATIPKSIAKLSGEYQRDAVRVTIEDALDDTADIRQLRLVTEPDEKFHGLAWLLSRYPHESALVFCNFKATVVDLATSLAREGISVGRFDGDLDQFSRDQVLVRFRNGSLRVLVATDVAGRGLDVEDLDLVINYEMPQQPAVYVHRIGRTGRAGSKGVAVSMMTPGQQGRRKAIEELTGVSIEELDWKPVDDPDLPRLLGAIARPPVMETVLISSGRKNKVRPGDILGALTGEAGGLEGAQIGKIEIHDRLSYVAVSRDVVQHAVTQLNRGHIKRKRVKATLVGGV